MSQRLSRRAALRGAGVTMALPLLECMLPGISLARSAPSRAPQRLAFLYIPNGVIQECWIPEQEGRDFTLPPTLTPLREVREQVSVLSGLDRTFAGGTGVHAQSGACWLSSSPPSDAKDGAFPTDISLDQLAARKLGTQTLFPSLELSANNHTNNKETKYFESISWLGPGYAANVEKNPRSVFRRLFRVREEGAAHRSVLDAVVADAGRLRKELGRGDTRKFDEYLESVRAIETRMEFADQKAAELASPPIAEPAGIPDDRGEYIRLMGDLFVLAFQLDLTRVATLLVDPERWDTPRMYHGVFDKPQNHHVLTHTKGDEAREKLKRIDRFHVEQFAYIVRKLRSIQEGEKTLLDNSLVVLGSGLGDGRVHSYKNLPVVLAGRGGGRIDSGQHVKFSKGTPLANLWLTLLHTVGVPEKRFADSTGRLDTLLV